MKKVLIVGSCVSRDILNFDVSAGLSLEAYFARSSLASMFGSCPFEEDVFSPRLKSKFQQQIVRADIMKEAYGAISKTKADIILLDLIDERFNLFATKIGICTNSVEFSTTGALAEVPDGTLIASGSAQFFDLWLKGWSGFVRLLQECSLMSKLRLNKVFWASETESGLGFLPHYSKEKIDVANAFLCRLYQEIEPQLEADQIYEFSSDAFVGADEHRWGKSPFHYADGYYRKALSRLLED